MTQKIKSLMIAFGFSSYFLLKNVVFELLAIGYLPLAFLLVFAFAKG
jgi:hypothetical protein